METIIKKESVDLDSLFSGVDTDNVLTPEIPNIFDNKVRDSILDQPIITKNTEKPEEEQEVETKLPINKEEANKILDSLGKDDEEEEEVETKGRPKTDKNALTGYLKTKIESKQFQAFEDWDENKESLEDYLAKQPEKALHQMLDANWDAKEREALEKTTKDFYESLPEPLQYAANYALNGGTDMKGLFAALSRVEQVNALDTNTEEGQTTIARSYLQATDFGTPEEIEEEIVSWKETNRLEKKAKDFKPRLDDMQKEQVEYQLQQQQEWNKQQQQAAQMYVNNVGQALQKGELDGIKIDKKTQQALYLGLTNASYPSASGKATNILGHLLDKIQYVEPNFELLADVTLHLMDPKAYKESILQQGKNIATTEVARKLKSEQGTVSGGYYTEEEEPAKPKIKKLSKPRNILERV